MRVHEANIVGAIKVGHLEVDGWREWANLWPRLVGGSVQRTPFILWNEQSGHRGDSSKVRRYKDLKDIDTYGC